MKWVSFEREKPFNDQLILIYHPRTNSYSVMTYKDGFGYELFFDKDIKVRYKISSDSLWLSFPIPPKEEI